jgi:Xylose isomerase-like TIM barrel
VLRQLWFATLAGPRSFASLRMTAGLLKMTAGLLKMTAGMLGMTVSSPRSPFPTASGLQATKQASAIIARMPRLLLKARPTPRQLADRLRAPYPDGLELYLDAVDLADEAAMGAAVANLEACKLPADFTLLIEGPVRSLDGAFFDLTREAEADLEVVRRLGRLASRIGARAVNVHAIAPTAESSDLRLSARDACLRQALPLTRFFVDVISAAGAVPTVENMPPVLRMRESGFFYSPIGMPAEDLVWLCDQAPGLRSTLDISHAGLYVNCQRYAAGAATPPADAPDCFELFGFVRQLPPVESLEDYAATLGETLVTCHVSNASGVLGESEPYDRGDLPLDDVVRELAPRTAYFVTETLEADQNQAVNMRHALESMRRALEAVPSR